VVVVMGGWVPYMLVTEQQGTAQTPKDRQQTLIKDLLSTSHRMMMMTHHLPIHYDVITNDRMTVDPTPTIPT